MLLYMDPLEIALIKDTLCDDFCFDWESIERSLKNGSDFMVEDLDKKVASPKKSQTIPCFANLGEGSSNGVLDVDSEKVALFGLNVLLWVVAVGLGKIQLRGLLSKRPSSEGKKWSWENIF
ncbi:hypothetical protein LOK49_LG12G00198 [Camellia lanceoleosa]|uniref:Uncharacterized protein n=1 Tax=Camellia lanceoleosa TaxID=1840588 RepID=A0ACC0FR58_9ERIC|nr:hypothetical protein LOK49_LG12G00198 [Camellia lanceoleosa]